MTLSSNVDLRKDIQCIRYLRRTGFNLIDSDRSERTKFMLKGIWTVGVKVPNLERELDYHRALGNEVVLDEKLELDGEFFRLPLIKVGDKYTHIAEKMVYEAFLDDPLPCGIMHLVYVTTDFDADRKRAVEAGAVEFHEPVEASAEFGRRRVAFLKTPSGYVVEYIDIIENLVPEVV